MLVILFMVSGFALTWHNAGIETAIGVYLMALSVAAYGNRSVKVEQLKPKRDW